MSNSRAEISILEWGSMGEIDDIDPAYEEAMLREAEKHPPPQAGDLMQG